MHPQPLSTVVITGVAPNGLSEAACSALAAHSPALLILTARTASKAEAVVAHLRATYPASSTQYVVVALDLSSLASVRKGAAAIREAVAAHSSGNDSGKGRGGRGVSGGIDVLLNNAGVMAIPTRTLSPDGVEMHLATNYLGHFLLTTLLLPELEAAAAVGESGWARSTHPRVVNITSAGFALTPFRFSDYNFADTAPDARAAGGKGSPPPLPADEEVDVAAAAAMGFPNMDPQSGYLPFLAYAQANTANMLFSVRLAEALRGKGVGAFSAAPGVSVTELQRHLPAGFKNPMMVYKTHSQAVASFLVAALDPGLQSEFNFGGDRSRNLTCR